MGRVPRLHQLDSNVSIAITYAEALQWWRQEEFIGRKLKEEVR